ncbi:cupin-like domain-containing protein [Sphingomonas abietis]|uniref:Cupin-like domain-containing protein n=1 Tax=Sphingomonas abietis TaxID=3012344 RepID=A0ABY7NMP9_9SPHN|nr:cupin-like domain-containing protein [Sphingomonas abietis]WBO21862.1 cupin-like domain-containing protein [Sphingomonas abietis]
MRAIREIEGVDRDRFAREILPSGRPAVLRGLAAEWPAVRAAARPGGVAGYLAAFGAGSACEMIVGPPAIEGRLFYDADMTGLNFTREPGSLGQLLSRLADAALASAPPTLAVQSLDARASLPGFAEENGIDLIDPAIGPRLWIGNRVVVATHQDMMENIAVVVAGRRRFTLFPPEQAGNLAIGPLEFTPAGTPVSLVDAEAPDLARFPRFAAALAQAETAELAPGDAIFIPYMWWHHVRSLDAFNLLANYWWSTTPPAQPGLAPIDALVHARLAIGDLPERQRAAWRAMFELAVFDGDCAHIPPARRGIRGAMTEAAKARLRRQLGQLMAR